MDSTPSVRAFEVGAATVVVELAGELDASIEQRLEVALAERTHSTVIVDLLAARNVDAGVQDVIIDAARTGDVVVVADAVLLHVLELRSAGAARLEPSLAAAVRASL